MTPEEIAFPRSVSDMVKFRSGTTIYAKSTPMHVRGALLFNHHIKKAGLENKYSLINSGEKIKFCYLKIPNLIGENVISFISDFPREIKLEKYVDYETQFNKGFVDPLKIILDAIGWNCEKQMSLESFFS